MRVYDNQGREVDVRGFVDADGQALGDLPGGVMAKALHGIPGYEGYTEVMDQYIINIVMNGEGGSTESDSVPLRPYDFILKRITWACTGDASRETPEYVANPLWTQGGSIMGRCAEMEWEDEFTKFLGGRRVLVSALLGDSNGFLDLPKLIRFEGKQSLTVSLNQLFYPWPPPGEGAPFPDFRWDFVFHGTDLYPPGKEREKKQAE